MKETDEEIARRAIAFLHFDILPPKFSIIKNNITYTIQWDGCAKSDNNIIIIEVERGKINKLHIIYHLLNLLLLIKNGISIDKIIWIVDWPSKNELKEIIKEFNTIFDDVFTCKLPPYEIRDSITFELL